MKIEHQIIALCAFRLLAWETPYGGDVWVRYTEALENGPIEYVNFLRFLDTFRQFAKQWVQGQ